MAETFRDLSGSGQKTKREASGSRTSSGIRDYSTRASAESYASGSRSSGSYSYASAGNGSTRRSQNGYASSGNGYQSRASSDRSSQDAARRAAARRKKQAKKRQRAVITGMLLLIALLAVTVAVVVKSCNEKPAEPPVPVVNPDVTVFPSGVYINGIDVSGKTPDEARTVLMPGITQNSERVAISLTGQLGTETFYQSITAGDMNLSSDIEQVLLDALAGGKNKAYATGFIVDYDALDRRIHAINSALSFGPEDAVFSLTKGDNKKPTAVYTEGHSGMGIDVNATEALVRETLESGTYQTTLTPPLTEQAPTVTVADLKEICSLLATFSTEYSHKGGSSKTAEEKEIIVNRAFNVNKAAGLINGTVVQPGESFSYNTTVGNRTEKNGWKQANAVTGGETYRLEYGGGVCQVSTTLYNALLRSGISYDAMTRRKHSIPADYVPLGLDATVDTGHIDFKFKNTTDYPLYIFAYTETVNSRKSNVTVMIYGQALQEGVSYKPRAVTIEEILPGDPIIKYDKKQPEGYEVTTVSARNGYKVEVYLDKYQGKSVVESKYLYTDEYEAIAQKITMGTKVVPADGGDPSAPVVTPAPAD